MRCTDLIQFEIFHAPVRASASASAQELHLSDKISQRVALLALVEVSQHLCLTLFLARPGSPLVTQRRVSQERLYLTPPPVTTYQKPLATISTISTSPGPNGGRGRARSLDSPRALMEPSRVAPLQLQKPKPTVFAPWAPEPYSGPLAPQQPR